MWYVTVVSPRWFPVFIRVWGALVSASYSLFGDGQSVFHTAYVCNGPDRDIHPDNSVLFRPNSYHAFLGTCGSSIICNLVWLWNSSLIVHLVTRKGGTMIEWQAQFALSCGGLVGFRLFVPTRLAVVMCYRCLFIWEGPSALCSALYSVLIWRTPRNLGALTLTFTYNVFSSMHPVGGRVVEFSFAQSRFCPSCIIMISLRLSGTLILSRLFVGCCHPVS